MPLTRLLPGLLLGILLSACASQQPDGGGSKTSIDDMGAAMASWKGHSAREAVAMWGMPDSMGREGTVGVLRWKAHKHKNASGSADWTPPEFEPPTGNQRPWPMLCSRTIVVDAAEIIQDARWSGSDCSNDAEEYAPPGSPLH